MAGGYKTCVHCGTPYSAAARPDSEFCCNGCAYVHRLIRQAGLEHYYELRDRRIPPVGSAALQPRDYGWLEARAAASEAASPNLAELVLDLEGISCIGCVWLIEKLFRDHPGAVRIEINTQYGQVRLQWRPGVFRVADFAREIQQFGYVLGPPGERPQQESRRLAGRIGLCAAFALNTMLFTLPRYLGMEPDFFLADLFELLSLLFATLSLLAGGSYFIKRGLLSLRQGVLHIDLPIALGIVLAWAGSLLGWALDDPRFLYFDFVAIFIFLMLTGRWVQERALERNRHRLLSRNKAPREAHVVADDLATESVLPLERLEPGQRLRVLPGEVVPVLAELESAMGAFSLEWINGESAMRTLGGGQWVPAGAQNIGVEPVLVRARQRWADSLLFRLLTAQPADQRHRFMERVLRVYLLAVLAVALAGALVWALGLGDGRTALQVLLSVLVVSCPCAIGVAYPLAQEWAVLQLRRHGVFVRTPDLFAALGKVRQVVFDKTGTLTLEAPELANPQAMAALSPADRAVLREMVQASLHPVSRALREALLGLPEETIRAPADLAITEEIGMGLVATAGDTRWTLGRPGWAESSERSDAAAGSEQPEGCRFCRDGRRLAGFVFREALREDAQAALQELRARFPVTILSGDQEQRVRELAALLGLPAEAALGGQSPQQKARFMEQAGRAALFVGDGANDALAFARAAVRGTPATPHGLLQDKADFYFTGRGLGGLLRLFAVHRLRRRAVRAAFVLAVAYNVAVVAVALAGRMHPLLAAILMPLSSLATIGVVAAVYRHGARQLQT